MTMQDFGETVACLMRITWAAAAGRLHLMSVNQPIRESTAATGRRSRQSSTGLSQPKDNDFFISFLDIHKW